MSSGSCGSGDDGPSRLPLLQLSGVGFTYARERSWRRRGKATGDEPAVADVSLEVQAGECLGLVGESGSGKTTLGHCIVGLSTPTTGEIRYRGGLINGAGAPRRLPRAHGIQVIFQDPYSSLNPRRRVGSLLAEVLLVHRLCRKADVPRRVTDLLEAVGLSSEHATVRPNRLSGGQRQRVAIARALAFEPELVVADEIVSALDASVQAQILNLIARLRSDLGLTLVFITHDLAVVRQVCDRVAVMTGGRLVEVGTVSDVLAKPQDPYTRSLLAAVPRLTRGPEVHAA